MTKSVLGSNVKTIFIPINGVTHLVYFLWRKKMCKTGSRVLNINLKSQTGVKAQKAASQHSVDNEEVGSDRHTPADALRELSPLHHPLL